MINRHLTFYILLIISIVSAGCSDVQPDIDPNGKAEIYGSDDRVDLYQLPNSSKILDWARSTAFVVKKSALKPDGADHHILQTFELNEGLKLCEDVDFRFSNQPMTEGTSAFLVAPDLIATAGHYTKINKLSCKEDLAFVFGYAIFDKKDSPQEIVRIPNEHIAYCSEPVAEVYKGPDANNIIDLTIYKLTEVLVDYAIFRLTKRFENRNIRELDLEMPTVGQSVMAIGHGLGLPTKVATGVVTSVGKRFFVTDMDLFHGNSGSLVLNPETGNILGMAVGSPGSSFKIRELENDDYCREFVPCPENTAPTPEACWGNLITPTATFAPELAE